ncbi:MAG: hypothetical protein Ct9H90mP16_17700 [Candidatus Poseidoniales archaeon]|nr:MAG: hypothetical protein Ct9H90mP16_17700 [Candidatus Poseidoniales archaeon]
MLTWFPSVGWCGWNLSIDIDILHALFHGIACIPHSFGRLGRVGLAKVPRLTPRLREGPLDDSDGIFLRKQPWFFLNLKSPSPSEKRPVQKLMATALIFILIAHIVLIEMSNHPEGKGSDQGDRALIEAFEELPDDAILYTETAHWGFCMMLILNWV